MTFFQLQLKPLTVEQLDAVVELDRLCLGGLWTMEGYRRELDSPNSELLVLSIPGQSHLLGVGCFWAILEEAHITILAVHPNYHGQGLGKLLLSALLARAGQRGLERATLEVRTSNAVALGLYEKFGFKVAGSRPKYYQNPAEDALILWRSGLQYPSFAQEVAQWQAEAAARLKEYHWHWSETIREVRSPKNP
ncbi:ribosomal protein S18-alanine N-acetyltransferase [Spirulina subsalsa FACHB-351]|uniref:Ribosomal protein S18-alanine N-acetyltransferase n=1 Tax=Spirulina subsalsa FACHB-351 TaxID=234711 RepID=A0ABT3L988_9CYAN|nr:ribosomal protein S18-alanine N-acetyltransferase [Spirulina subsalsa]MCW6038027.1 ribosomal protein S18-alanine N-acetyltransferase [Spirulina subsalsa FACHB-351]